MWLTRSRADLAACCREHLSPGIVDLLVVGELRTVSQNPGRDEPVWLAPNAGSAAHLQPRQSSPPFGARTTARRIQAADLKSCRLRCNRDGGQAESLCHRDYGSS